MTERESPLRLLFVGVDGATVEGVTAALGPDAGDGGVEATRVRPAEASPDASASGEYDCVVVAAEASDEWTGAPPASVPRVQVRAEGTEGGAVADRLAARVRAAVGVSDERRRAVERTTEAVYAVDADWRITLWNDAVADRTGRTAASVLGRALWDAFPELVGTRLEAEYRSAMEGGEARTVEATPAALDDRVESRVFPEETGVTVYARNVTEGRERARRLELYERALEAVRDPVFVVDGDRRVAFANAALLDHAPDLDADPTGASVRDLLGGAAAEGVGRLEGAVDAALDAAGTERAAGFERRVVVRSTAGGGLTSVDYRVTPFDGERPHALVVGRDVTELERANREARTVAERLEALVEATPVPVIGVDADGEVTLWNDAAEATFGWSSEEVLGEFNPIVPDSERADFAVNRNRLLDGERVVEREVERRNRAGETLDLRLSAVPVEGSDGDAGGTEVVGVFEDLTERRRYERRLRALQNATGRLNVASTRDAIAERAVEAAVDVLEMDLTALYGYDPERNALVPVARGAGTEEAFDELPTFGAGEGLVWEAFEDGEPRVDENVSGVSGRYNAETPVGAELIVPLGEHGVLLTGSTATHAFDETEVAMFRSLAGAVEAALTRADREGRLARQNERLEEFSRVVAHDLRNPIGVAEGFLDLARETGDPDHFDRVERALDRMSRLVDDLLALARRGGGEGDDEPVDLAEAAREAWRNVETRAATLDADGLPTVTGDPGRLAQLFENLFRNAVEHGGDAVTVRAGALNGGGFHVTDDGDGIPPDERERVFEQGYTTRRDGTGFGLPIVEEVAAGHGLTVEATEGPDGGARFEFRPE